MFRVLGLGVAVAATALSMSAVYAQTPVKFSLDWKFEGPSAPFLVALEKGYFKDEGLDVTIDTGNGSVEPIPRRDRRLPDGLRRPQLGDQVPRRTRPRPQAVLMVYDKPVFSIVGRKSSASPTIRSRLEGKTLGAPPPDGAFAQWPIQVGSTASTTAPSPSRTSASRCASRCWRRATSTRCSASRSR
jgi:NitT/TauT family transport system substrate-binding protein